MKRSLVFTVLALAILGVVVRSQPGAITKPAVTAFHNCSMVGESANSPHLFDRAKTYKCDEGTIEIAGRREMTIEKGYVYETELGEMIDFSTPRRVSASDYRDYKWCPDPSQGDPNQMKMCGETQPICYDGKPGTWDAAWQGYSCVTPDHK
jgi:hypothetical protein